MNLSKFLNAVDSTSKSMEKEQLIVLIHDIARVLPEHGRDDFLDRMKKCCQSDCTTDSFHMLDEYGKEHKAQYEKIKENLMKIENWEIGFIGELNLEYDDWYSNDEEFLYEDPQGVGKILEEACQFVHECVDKEYYQEGYDLCEILIGLKIMVGGEYQEYTDDPLGIEDVKQYGLAWLNYRMLVTDAAYLTYCITPIEERAGALYVVIQNAGIQDISLETIMQCGEELPEFEEFLSLWTAYLGNKNSHIAQRLLLEAVELSNSPEKLLSNARIYYEQHPGLYEMYLKGNLGIIDRDELISVGQEALEKIDNDYLVRSRIALLMADIMMQENHEVTNSVERCWLEAFRSDTRVVHYLRMMMECNDFSVWKEDVQKIYHGRLKKIKQRECLYGLSADLQKNEANSNQLYLIALLNGEYRYVKDHGMNVAGALGWSGSYMKIGLAAFLLMLLRTETVSDGGKAMLSKIVSSLGLKTGEYKQGTFAEINDTEIEWLWKCFSKSKLLHPMAECDYETYLRWIEKLVEKRTTGIMENNRRNYYRECAEYIAALGEVMNDKQKIMLEYKQRYPRRRAFHSELRACGMLDGLK